MLTNQQWRLDLGDRGVLKPGPWLWLRATGWNALLFLGAVFFFFGTILQLPWLHLRKDWPMTIGLLGPVLAFLVYALAVHIGERRRPREIALSLSTGYELLIGALIGFAMMVGTLLLLWTLGLYHVRVGHLTDWMSFLVFNSYISGMLEELAFRAILLRLFARAFGPRWGLALSRWPLEQRTSVMRHGLPLRRSPSMVGSSWGCCIWCRDVSGCLSECIPHGTSRRAP
jgi:membrane protease YdiL (CAAX protease family)